MELIPLTTVGDVATNFYEENKMSTTNNTKLLAVVVSIIAIFTLSACATIDGAGEDIESVGEKIQE